MRTFASASGMRVVRSVTDPMTTLFDTRVRLDSALALAEVITISPVGMVRADKPVPVSTSASASPRLIVVERIEIEGEAPEMFCELYVIETFAAEAIMAIAVGRVAFFMSTEMLRLNA